MTKTGLLLIILFPAILFPQEFHRPTSDSLPSFNNAGEKFSAVRNEIQLSGFYPESVSLKTFNDSLLFTYSYDSASGSVIEIQQSVYAIPENSIRNTISKVPGKKTLLTEIWVKDNWAKSSRFTEEYDQAGNIILVSYETFDGVSWWYNFRNIFTYEYGRQQTFLREFYDRGSLVYKVLETYTYNKNFMITFLVQLYRNGAWQNSAKGEWVRDSFGNPHQYFYKVWRNDSWNDSSRVFTYYNNDLKDTLTTIEAFDGLQWSYFLKQKSEFNTAGLRTEQSYYKWNNNWYKWVNLRWDYDLNGNCISEIYQKGESDTWVNFSRKTWQFRYPGKPELYTLEYWSTQWDNYNRETFLYDKDANLIDYVSLRWFDTMWEEYDNYITITDPEGNQFAYTGSRIHFNYQFLSSADNAAQLPEYFLLQNYPNPFNSSTNIYFSLAKTANVELTIYDVLGSEIRKLVNGELQSGEHHYMWDGKNTSGVIASSGIYFYTLKTAGQLFTRKMNLLK